MFGKGFIIFNVVIAGLGALASVVTAVDQVKNGDRRAQIAGDAAGRAIVDEGQKTGLFGVKVDKDGKIV